MFKFLITGIVSFLLPITVLCQTDAYKVYALKFKYTGMTQARNAIVGAPDKDSVDVCYMIWFLKGSNGRNILVDAGDLDSVKTGIKSYVRPDQILRDIQVTPQEITDIIITHPHYDHIGGIALFPKGRIWMQKKDFDYFAVEAWKEGNNPIGFSPDDVRHLMDASLKGRLNLVYGDDIEIIPGIRVFTGSMHTNENQYLQVMTESGNRIVLASDAIWFYLNLWHLAPATLVHDPVAYVNAMKRMKTMVSDERYIIPGHDHRVFSTFEKINDRVVIIR